MQQNSSEQNVWFRFFKDASIPAGFAQNYAKKFVENRIRFEMLADLDRPLLNELGITAIGDCLSILKHAKSVSQQSMDFETEPKTEPSSVVKRMVASTVQPATAGLKADSNLSTDLYSRINFNPKTNEDSTTLVRKSELNYDDDEDMPMSRPAADIKSTVVQINNKNRGISLNEKRQDNIPIQRRINMEPGKANTVTRLHNNNSTITRTVSGGQIQRKIASPVKKPTSLAEKIANQNKFGADADLYKIKPKQEQKPYDARLTITKTLATRNGNGITKSNPFNSISKEAIQNKNIVITLENELAVEKNRKVVPITQSNRIGPKPIVSQAGRRPQSTVVRPATVAKMNSVVSRVSNTVNSRVGGGAIQRMAQARRNLHDAHRTDRRLHSRISF